MPVKVPDTHRCRFLLCNAVRLMKRSQTRKERFCQPLSLLYWNSGKIARKIFGQFKNFLFPKDILKEKISEKVTVQPLHLLVFIFMKTRSLVVPPYADLDEKVLMQASLQHTFSFKPAHG
ncbi:hypothetical protein [Pilosibacter fragilis]|uniref:hypothetical protein n=1 Tax=Pilosibacter fragilis TaxID=3078042 RepID=UPI0031BB24A7